MKKIMSFIISLFFLTLFSNSAFAAGDSENVKKLSSFKKTGTAAGEVIPQNTKFAENVKANIISKVNLPAGFKIELFAVVPDARHMAVARNKTTVWIGTRKDKVWQATDRDMDDVADTVEQFSPSVNFDIPNGVCFSDDGHLYIAERNRVIWFPAAEFFMESPDTVAIPLIPQGELIPPEDESYNHSARDCAVSPKDNKHYIYDEIRAHDTDKLAKEIKSRFPHNRLYGYPDSSGGARSTNATKTDIQILESYGISNQSGASNPSIKDSVNNVQRLLCNGKEEVNLFIHPRCKNLIESLEQRSFETFFA